jgi:hypothetical protein
MSNTSDPLEPQFAVRLTDVAVLLYNLHKGAVTAEVGYEDCEQRLEDFVLMLSSKKLTVKASQLERLLWSCVQLEEHKALTGGFWHHKDEELDAFIRRILYKSNEVFEFNKDYSVIRKKGNRRQHGSSTVVK